eukprot:COSAG05_NODE_442_length_9803_cov_28.091921_5_plen_194_part_00
MRAEDSWQHTGCRTSKSKPPTRSSRKIISASSLTQALKSMVERCTSVICSTSAVASSSRRFLAAWRGGGDSQQGWRAHHSTPHHTRAGKAGWKCPASAVGKYQSCMHGHAIVPAPFHAPPLAAKHRSAGRRPAAPSDLTRTAPAAPLPGPPAPVQLWSRGGWPAIANPAKLGHLMPTQCARRPVHELSHLLCC